VASRMASCRISASRSEQSVQLPWARLACLTLAVAALAALIGLCLAWFVPAVQVTYAETEVRSA